MRSPVISYSSHNKHRLEARLIPPVAPAGAAGAGTTGRDKHHGMAVAGRDSVPKRESASAPSPPGQTPREENIDTSEEFLFKFRSIIKMHK